MSPIPRRELGRPRREWPVATLPPVHPRPLSRRGRRFLAWMLAGILALILAAAARASDPDRTQVVAALREADAAVARLQSELSAQSLDLEQARADLAARAVELTAKQAREEQLVATVNDLGPRLLEAEKNRRAAEDSARLWFRLALGTWILLAIYLGLRLHPATRAFIP